MRSLVGLLKLLGCSRSQGKEGRQMEPCIFVKTLKNCPRDNPFSVSKAVGKSCYVSCSVLKIFQAMPDNSGMFSVGIYLYCIIKERYFSYDQHNTPPQNKAKTKIQIFIYIYMYIYMNAFAWWKIKWSIYLRKYDCILLVVVTYSNCAWAKNLKAMQITF